MIKDTDHSSLILFILKTRLTESAKLRLAEIYDSVDLLLKDMKQNLLTNKFTTAVHSDLIGTKQNYLSIDDYGKK